MTETFASGDRVELNGDALRTLHYEQRQGTVLGYDNDQGTVLVKWDGHFTNTLHQDWLRRPTTPESETLRLAGHLEDDPCPLEAAHAA